MRFPKLSELDKDQSAIYNGAPPEGTVMIVGPPGTGKSVIAFHRAHLLEKLRRNPRVVMFNNVLVRYTSSRGGVAESVEVSNLHSWAMRWWSKIIGKRNAMPPMVDGERYTHDWVEIQLAATRHAVESRGSDAVNWGHIIIDEGQDFPPSMYACLKMTMMAANMAGAEPKLAVTVLADENQRLTPNKNSKLEEIRQNLGLHADDRNVFVLKKNYRNTREVAEFAGSFYVGLPTGKPENPSRAGDKPQVSIIGRENHGKFLNSCADKIARYAKLRRTEEIAVITMRDSDRASMLNRLQKKLESEAVEIQSYSSKDKTLKAEKLTFDKPGRVTLLNSASAKGLEFDAVFIIDPGALMSLGSGDLNVKMTLYVLCSRSRNFLNIMLVENEHAKRLLEWVPAGLYEREIL